MRVLAINPGSTSTKLAAYDDTAEVFGTTVRHSTRELARYGSVVEQTEYRLGVALGVLEYAGIDVTHADAVVGRGGLTRPIPGGTYAVDDQLLDDLRCCELGEHASNLGAFLARAMGEVAEAPAYIVDPVIVDEFDPVARFSGHVRIQRRSIFHALNQKAVARRYAQEHHVGYDEVNLIVVHLGGGVSVGAHRRGRVVDVNNALNGEGPMAPERAGTLPVRGLVELCTSGRHAQPEMAKMLAGRGGFVSLLGTQDARTVAERAALGDAEAALVNEAFALQVAKEIGSAAAVLAGDVDAIVLTGGIAYNRLLTADLARRTAWIARTVVYPGEDEMKALCEGALRVLHGEEEAHRYADYV